MRRRVVVTGIGVITPIGEGRQKFWQGLLDGCCGFGIVKSFDTSRYGVHRGAEVKGFAPRHYVRNLDSDAIGRASQLAIGAARLAFEDAAGEESHGNANDSRAEKFLGSFDPLRVGVCVGTTSGEPREIERLDDRYVAGELNRVGPEFLSRYPCHVIGAYIASEFGLAGPNLTIPCACAAGNYAIAHAVQLIRSRRVDLALAGGSDAFSRITFTGFARLGAIAPMYCQPFDRARKGMIPGEAAGMLTLEPLELAVRRRARIYAEVTGCGLSCDAWHMTAAHPQGLGAARAMELAMSESGISPEQVDYLSAHGTGTPTNDRVETLAIKRAFGASAYSVPISSIKSMLGHTMGAASALEAAVCALSVSEGRVPPTINLNEPDAECDLDYIPNTAREMDVTIAMNNAYAFGGNNSSVIFQKLLHLN
jgi:3-oxoacyl-[acyl-carrier-protein] synthase II